jgi:UDPglucose 6-dehydrogenase
VVDEVNREQVIRVVNRINEILTVLGKNKKSCRIGILGLAYKPNTPVIEDSQALEIAELLVNEGYRVSVYDPLAQENARSVLGDTVRYTKDAQDCLADADAGVIAVPWQEFKKINFKKLNKNIILLDCWRLLEKIEGVNIKYLGIG